MAVVAVLFLAQHFQLAASSLYNANDSDGILSVWTPDPVPAPHPGYQMWDMYAYWDTFAINPYQMAVSSLPDSLMLHILHMDCGFSMPIAGALTSGFGYRWGRQHKGIDLDLNTGDTVVSMFDGVVRVSGYHSGYGNVVLVRHHNGLETVYGHLSRRYVKPGDMIYAGQAVGLGGSTGRSTGPHLHFETRFMGLAFDPQRIINIDSGELYDEYLTITPELFEMPAPPPSAYKTRKPASYYRRSQYRHKH